MSSNLIAPLSAALEPDDPATVRLGAHANDIGESCGHSGADLPGDTDPDSPCPAGCREAQLDIDEIIINRVAVLMADYRDAAAALFHAEDARDTVGAAELAARLDCIVDQLTARGAGRAVRMLRTEREADRTVRDLTQPGLLIPAGELTAARSAQQGATGVVDRAIHGWLRRG